MPNLAPEILWPGIGDLLPLEGNGIAAKSLATLIPTITICDELQ
jgi:hypothetical protein